MTEAAESGYAQRLGEEARFWDERADQLFSSGRIPLWFDHRRGEDLRSIPLEQLRGAAVRADPLLYRIVYGDLLARIIDEATQQRGRALDLGCGAGWLSLELARRGMEVEGYDIGPRQIEIAREFARESRESSDPLLHGDFGSADYGVLDLNRAVLEEEAYQVAVSVGTLHHIERLEHLLDQVQRGLKPGGKFVVYEYIGYQGPARIFGATFSLARAVGRLVKKIAGVSSSVAVSACEGVSQHEILELVESRFEVERKEYHFLFLPVLIAGLRLYRLPHAVGIPLVRGLYALEKLLGGSDLLRGPYLLAIARKR
ncbi:MAG: methyltransferase domain-containing protein [Anaerolineae bacterium]|jgi:2-polyprenyl-3-methyl-5-hydroxy-6-metoxy-1,4-benzoquinol methylase